MLHFSPKKAILGWYFACPNPLEQHLVVVSAFWPPQARGWRQILAGFGLNPRRGAQDLSGITTTLQALPQTPQRSAESRIKTLFEVLTPSSPPFPWSPHPHTQFQFFFFNPPFPQGLFCFGFSTIWPSRLWTFPFCCSSSPAWLLLPKLKHYFSAEMTSWLKMLLEKIIALQTSLNIPFCNPLFQHSPALIWSQEGWPKTLIACPHPFQYFYFLQPKNWQKQQQKNSNWTFSIS